MSSNESAGLSTASPARRTALWIALLAVIAAGVVLSARYGGRVVAFFANGAP